jgi:hypothetical protein
MKTFIKYTVITLIAVSMLGCNIDSEETTSTFNIPKELSDCKIYKVGTNKTTERTDIITVVRCPNSSTSTTYRSGKSTYSVTVLD